MSKCPISSHLVILRLWENSSNADSECEEVHEYSNYESSEIRNDEDWSIVLKRDYGRWKRSKIKPWMREPEWRGRRARMIHTQYTYSTLIFPIILIYRTMPFPIRPMREPIGWVLSWEFYSELLLELLQLHWLPLVVQLQPIYDIDRGLSQRKRDKWEEGWTELEIDPSGIESINLERSDNSCCSDNMTSTDSIACHWKNTSLEGRRREEEGGWEGVTTGYT